MSCSSRTDLLSRYHALRNRVGRGGASLLSVSKYAPDAAVEILIEAGARQFGEARAQQLRDRAQRWPDCDWHMIGPMQKNKAKYIGRHAAMWHSCEDAAVAEAVAKYVSGRILPVLIQVNLAQMPGQHGVDPDAVPALADALEQLPQLKLVGLMGMAPKHGAADAAFHELRGLRDALFGGKLSESAGSDPSRPDHLRLDYLRPGQLCMVMSGDYEMAMAEGSTMVRLGSILFGDWDTRLSSQAD